jgi:hypothetical protein
LEECFAVSYYSRLRLITNLLPLLHRAPHPRILSILNGTKEKRINEDDLGLEKSWSIVNVVNHTTICTSLAFDHLASNDDSKRLTLIHATPGFVNTGTPRTTYPSTKDGYLWFLLISVLQVVSGWIIVHFGFSLTESGERHAFHLTSDMYTPGSHRTDKLNEIHQDNKVLRDYKQHGWLEKIWDHTCRVWDRALAKQGAETG